VRPFGSVVGKSITTNPGYFSSGRFLNGEGVKTFIVFTIGVTCKELKGFSFILLRELIVFYEFFKISVKQQS
jgi:hypothetical protein